MRKLAMAFALLILLAVSGCATTFENLAAGAVLGGVLVGSTLSGGCSHNCY
ncbi:hypothetical protein OVY01_08865 [Robbsia sp. Bb-Pol-6]|uniref:Lipoprotein n=1 Tax=Robbsia betulipollinis TaxID=2981849 RepID=A0ABT3ZLC4_9BURK|nr:hypothetical protein [Robbsia betulipollinis]MCY0387343.1 hypothetical protein [Robbsia betulipollinis]